MDVEQEKRKFLNLCGIRDRALLSGKKRMTLGDTPGVQVSPDQAAPAVRRPGQGRARPSGGTLTHFCAVHNIAA